MAIEQIGLPIDLTTGNHFGTEYSVGVLKLSPTGNSGGQPLYPTSGYWVSDTINLLDKITEYGNVVFNRVDTNSSAMSISTATSDDGITFDPFIPLNMTGKIESVKRLYIQVKVEMFAGFGNVTAMITDFDLVDRSKFTASDYVEFNGSLTLKKNYNEPMVEDTTWAGSGTLLRHTINLDELRKIDTIDMV